MPKLRCFAMGRKARSVPAKSLDLVQLRGKLCSKRSEPYIPNALPKFMAELAWHRGPDCPRVAESVTALASPESRIPAVNVEDRKLAEFSDEEINEILRQAGYRSLVSAEAPR